MEELFIFSWFASHSQNSNVSLKTRFKAKIYVFLFNVCIPRNSMQTNDPIYELCWIIISKLSCARFS